MNTFYKTLSVSILALAMSACGGDDGERGSQGEQGVQGPQGAQGPQGEQGPAAEIPPETTIQVLGGRIAQDFADATADITFATREDGAVAGADTLEFEEDEDDVRPGPPSVGADIPVTYFGPAPSDSNPRLIGPVQLLTAGTIDEDAGTITLPLYEGQILGDSDSTFYYIVTDTTDKGTAEALGLNHASKLTFSKIVQPVDANDLSQGFESSTVRSAYYNADGVLLARGGTVDFSPVRSVVPGVLDASGTNNLLGSLAFTPGAIGANEPSNYYSPLVMIENAGGHIYNAPTVSSGASEEQLALYCDGISSEEEEAARAVLHDSVVAICPGDDGEPGTVTMELVLGFSFGRPVFYLSTDASADIAAALEGAIFAPALQRIPVGRDDSLFSSIERIFGFTNGAYSNVIPEGDTETEVHPLRQGFNSAILGQGGPLNVLGGIPTIATDYSPLWDLNLGEWTQEAIDRGYRGRMTEEFQILGFVERGFVTGPGGTPYGSSGIIINCPIVSRLL